MMSNASCFIILFLVFKQLHLSKRQVSETPYFYNKVFFEHHNILLCLQIEHKIVKSSAPKSDPRGVKHDLSNQSLHMTYQSIFSCYPSYNQPFWVHKRIILLLLQCTGLAPIVFIHYFPFFYLTRWLANPSRGRTHFPRDFWSSYEQLVHCQSKGSHAIDWSSTIATPPGPHNVDYIDLRIVFNF